MDAIPLAYLVVLLVVFILLSAFFSGSETGLMSLNRYRLRHMAKNGNKGAIFATKLLEKPASPPVTVRTCQFCKMPIEDGATRCPHCTSQL